jgi:protein-L-isoaspartate O-methyltransferase
VYLDWEKRARQLADAMVRPDSRWYEPLAAIPRHAFVPRWWVRCDGGRELRIGREDPERWMQAAYADRTIVTRVGTHHADHASPGDIVTGRTTSSATMPSVVVTMYRHAMFGRGGRCTTLVTTGSGYGTALLCRRLGDVQVTSMDIDPYLVDTAASRLSTLSIHPQMVAGDITALTWEDAFERIVSTVSVPRVPGSWLTALRPGGRLVTTLANTGLILTADKRADGSARGRIEFDRASFMAARQGSNYPPTLDDVFAEAEDGDGEDVHTSPWPVLDVAQAWDVWAMLTLMAPEVEHRSDTDRDGNRLTWMLHPDGSWARACTKPGQRNAVVHQHGQRRLYDLLDEVRWRWLERGELPAAGAGVTITPDGETTLSRDGWSVTL